eukprot:748122-Hanusia_phi.AAC.3
MFESIKIESDESWSFYCEMLYATRALLLLYDTIVQPADLVPTDEDVIAVRKSLLTNMREHVKSKEGMATRELPAGKAFPVKSWKGMQVGEFGANAVLQLVLAIEKDSSITSRGSASPSPPSLLLPSSTLSLPPPRSLSRLTLLPSPCTTPFLCSSSNSLSFPSLALPPSLTSSCSSSLADVATELISRVRTEAGEELETNDSMNHAVAFKMRDRNYSQFRLHFVTQVGGFRIAIEYSDEDRGGGRSEGGRRGGGGRREERGERGQRKGGEKGGERLAGISCYT